MKTATEIITILTEAQIKFNRSTSIWGSEYWTISGVNYRISNHDKPDGQIYSGVDVRSFDNLFFLLKSRLNLESKKEAEKIFKESAIKTLKLSIHPQFGNIITTPDGAIFEEKNIDSALNYLWKKSLN